MFSDNVLPNAPTSANAAPRHQLPSQFQPGDQVLVNVGSQTNLTARVLGVHFSVSSVSYDVQLDGSDVEPLVITVPSWRVASMPANYMGATHTGA